MKKIICPKCNSTVNLRKDHKSKSGWTCNSCNTHCIEEKNITNKKTKNDKSN